MEKWQRYWYNRWRELGWQADEKTIHLISIINPHMAYLYIWIPPPSTFYLPIFFKIITQKKKYYPTNLQKHMPYFIYLNNFVFIHCSIFIILVKINIHILQNCRRFWPCTLYPTLIAILYTISLVLRQNFDYYWASNNAYNYWWYS